VACHDGRGEFLSACRTRSRCVLRVNVQASSTDWGTETGVMTSNSPETLIVNKNFHHNSLMDKKLT
jgi:hypothetical protein